MLLLIFLIFFLLSFPSLLFVRFRNLCLGFFLKFSLWSLIVKKHCCLVIASILSSTLNFFVITFASFLILVGMFGLALLYVFVIFSCKIFSYSSFSNSESFIRQKRFEIVWCVLYLLLTCLKIRLTLFGIVRFLSFLLCCFQSFNPSIFRGNFLELYKHFADLHSSKLSLS